MTDDRSLTRPFMPHIRSLRFIPLLAAMGCSSPPQPEDHGAPSPLELDPIYFAMGALYEYMGYHADMFGDCIDTFAATKRREASRPGDPERAIRPRAWH